MADTLVYGDPRITLDTFFGNGIWGIYWLNDYVGAIIFIDTDGSAGKISAIKTTDGGATWGSPVSPETGTAVYSLACWFDQQTPGDSGTKVHTAYLLSSDLHRYSSYDISANTWSTPNTIATVVENITVANNQPFILKTRGGNVIAGVATGSGSNASKASSPYTSWSSIANPYESNASDQVLGIHANTTDTNDAAILFWDISANQITVKVYDDSGDSWSEKTPAGSSNTEDNVYKFMSTTTRLSDGHVLVGYMKAGNDTLRFWDLEIIGIGFGILTTYISTDIASGIPGVPSIFLDQETDDIYVSCITGALSGGTNQIKYYKSIDGGTNWTGPTTYNETDDDYRVIGYSAMGTGGGRFQPVWFDDDDNDLFNNLVNDIALPVKGYPPSVTNSNVIYQPAGSYNSFHTTPAIDSATIIYPQISNFEQFSYPLLFSVTNIFYTPAISQGLQSATSYNNVTKTNSAYANITKENTNYKYLNQEDII